ncbi:MAG: cysteine desulfurase, partial [Oscillospiraceae bacterium]|nr:cysteine desulfurase [Oscillospiraceae bacterium]
IGREAAQGREDARSVIAKALGCESKELFFTSCGTEGDNWAISAALQYNKRKGNHIVTTAIEHSAVLEPMKKLKNEGYEVTFLTPDATGHIDRSAVREAIRPDTVLVSMMLVNNELGTLLPVRAAHEAIREKGAPALLHTDAVQGFLKVPFTPKELGADFVTICAHKIRGPKGIGGLYIRKELISNIKPLMLGGGQENNLRPGTEATSQIASFAAAVKAWRSDFNDRIRAVKDYAAQSLTAIEGVTLISGGDAPHILALSLPDFSGQSLVEALGSQGVCISSGSACHRGKPSHVFESMPLPQKVKYGAIRVSFGPESTKDEVDELCRLVRHICEKKTLLF